MDSLTQRWRGASDHLTAQQHSVCFQLAAGRAAIAFICDNSVMRCEIASGQCTRHARARNRRAATRWCGRRTGSRSPTCARLTAGDSCSASVRFRRHSRRGGRLAGASHLLALQHAFARRIFGFIVVGAEVIPRQQQRIHHRRKGRSISASGLIASWYCHRSASLRWRACRGSNRLAPVCDITLEQPDVAQAQQTSRPVSGKRFIIFIIIIPTVMAWPAGVSPDIRITLWLCPSRQAKRPLSVCHIVRIAAKSALPLKAT